MLNNVSLMGRLTRDPELRSTGSGVSVVSFSLAVERDFKDASGERATDFIDIVAWRQTADFVSKWFHKGQLVAVTGRLQSRNWEDKNGNKRVSVEVVADSCYFAERKQDGSAPAARDYGAPPPARQSAPAEPTPAYSYNEQNSFTPIDDDEDELPF